MLTNQKAIRGATALLDLTYDYNRNNSKGTLNGKTGHLTKITDNLNSNKNREYEFDAIGRLTKSKGGVNGGLWNQQYSYDRYGNRTNVTAAGVAADNSPIPLDGLPNLAYDNASNRITTTGFEYDSAGNQTRALAEGGASWLRYEYDAANRLRLVKQDNGTLIQAFVYGSTNARLIDFDAGVSQNKFFATVGGTTVAEYTEFQQNVPTWTKSYTYFGSSQLATVTPNGLGGEYVEFNHPDRLGARLVTNQAGGTVYEQNTLPFGTALNAESSLTTNNKRFTSYDRSSVTGLDYAINRTYDSKQGRFTQVDPIGIEAVDLNHPQTFNLYAYCGNDPINHVDPDGLFFGKFFKWIGKHIKKILTVVAVIVAIAALVAFPWSGPLTFKAVLGLVSSLAAAASSLLDLAGLSTLSRIFGFIALATGIATLGFEVKNAWQRLKEALSKVRGFADDVPFIGNFYVEVRWSERFIRAINSVGPQVSSLVGLSNSVGSVSTDGSRGKSRNRNTSQLKCIGRAWWNSINVAKTTEGVVSVQGGWILAAGGVMLGRYLINHGARAGSFWGAGDGLKTGPLMGAGGLGFGGMSMKHGVKTLYSHASSSLQRVTRCVKPTP